MISSLQQLATIPTILVLYHAGSSGEFLSLALSQVFAQVAKGKHEWHDSRIKYEDMFGRSFNSGDNSFLDTDLLLYRTNTYLESHPDPKLIHLGMVHPNPETLHFIQGHFANHPVIEISMRDPRSKQFALLAVRSKITHKVYKPISQIQLHGWPLYHNVKFKQHLEIEWQDLFFKSTLTFDSIQRFLNITGNAESFNILVEKYKHLNKHLLYMIDESYQT